MDISQGDIRKSRRHSRSHREGAMTARQVLTAMIVLILLLPSPSVAQEPNPKKANTANELKERDAQERKYNECTRRCDDRLTSCQRSGPQSSCSREYSSCSRECERIIH